MSTLIQLSGGGGSVNPTTGIIPYNNGGIFDDTTLNVNTPGPGVEILFKTSPNPSGLDLYLDPISLSYSIGDADPTGVSALASYGLAITGSGYLKLNSGVSASNVGVFSVDPTAGMIWIGSNGINKGIGYNMLMQSMFVGSTLIGSPSPSAIVKWIKITDEFFNVYFLPLYQ